MRRIVHDGPEPLRRRLQEAARAAGVFAPHVACGVGRARARPAAARPWCSRRPATRCSVRSRSTARRRTRATCTCSRWSPPRTAGAVPAPAGGRRGAVVLRDDRAGAGRRLRPARAAHHGDEGRAAGGSTAASGSSPGPTAPASPSAWPARRRAGDAGGATMFLVDADNPGMRGRPAHRHAGPGPVRRAQRGRLRRVRGRRRARCSARWTRASRTPRCGSGRPG